MTWDGTDALERQINSVRNALVYVLLDGVAGVSVPVPGYEYKLIPQSDATRTLEKGRKVLDRLAMQKAPRSSRRAQRWFTYHRAELTRIYDRALAVAQGRPQKMRALDYQALSASVSRSSHRTHGTATTARLPHGLYAAYEWTKAAGELNTLADLRGPAFHAYAIRLVKKAHAQRQYDVTTDELQRLAQWLRTQQAR